MLGYISPELVTILMFVIALVFILIGNEIAFSLLGASAVVGVLTLGPRVFHMFQAGVNSSAASYSLLAVPLFVFMGNMIETTGITRKMFDAVYVWIGHLKGGLLVVTVIIGTLLAACVGVIAASVTMLALIGLPMMMQRGYDKKLSTGVICASGSLGILIPPSVLLVVYGPAAGLSVGKLFTGAIGPGLMLSLLYIIYNVLRVVKNPSLAPVATKEEMDVPIKKKLQLLFFSFLPPIIIIFAVLGAIMFGIAAPTEAAAVGALSSIVLAIIYRKLTKENLKKALISTAKNYAMVQMIVWGAKSFTTLFLKLGCSQFITDMLTNMPGGKWMPFIIIMIIVFILGMFIDWIGIVLIMVPIVTPLAVLLGFNEIWFAMMIIVNLQLSFITPPFAYSIFFLKDVARPEFGISTHDIIKGIIPYVFIIVIGLILLIVFPQIILWLPSLSG